MNFRERRLLEARLGRTEAWERRALLARIRDETMAAIAALDIEIAGHSEKIDRLESAVARATDEKLRLAA